MVLRSLWTNLSFFFFKEHVVLFPCDLNLLLAKFVVSNVDVHFCVLNQADKCQNLNTGID